MLIQILPEGKDDGRKVTVSEGEEVLATFSAPSLKDAHKMIKQGRADGWDALSPKKGK